MKERFAKLLLGEDMSGGGKGVSSALALSNAITNLAGMLRSTRFPSARLLVIVLIECLRFFFSFFWLKEEKAPLLAHTLLGSYGKN